MSSPQTASPQRRSRSPIIERQATPQTPQAAIKRTGTPKKKLSVNTEVDPQLATLSKYNPFETVPAVMVIICYFIYLAVDSLHMI